MKKRKGKIVLYNLRSFVVLYFRDGHRIATTGDEINKYLKSIGIKDEYEQYLCNCSLDEGCEMLTKFYREAF